MQRFFSASKIQLAKQRINSFLHEPDESLREAWDRFQGYQRTCPHHGRDKRYLISTFLQGLKEDTRILIRVACRGSLNEKSFDFIEQQINKMANECAPSHEFIRNVSLKDSRAGKESLSEIQALRAELAKLKMQVENVHQISDLDTSANGYMIYYVYYVDNNLYSNVYNPGWKNHPNFSFKNSSNVLNTPHGNFGGSANQDLSQGHQPRPRVDSALDLKSMFAQLLQGQEIIRIEMREHQQETDTHLKLVDNQIAQLVTSIPSRSQGSLSDTPIKMSCEEEPKYVPPPSRPPPVPFPSRLVQHKKASQFKRFTDMIKKLEFTMPFHEVITQVPSYAKFLKDILSRKKTVERKIVSLTKECSAIFQHGASVSLMPLSIFKQLDVGELKPTQMILQLADRSTKQPAGILEDMPLKVGDYYIPVDFMVLDIDVDSSMPIILGRLFLNTADIVIHVRADHLTMSIGDETIEFMLNQNDNPDESVKSICLVYKLKTPKNQDHRHKVKRGPDPNRMKGKKEANMVEQVTNSSDHRENWLESHASPPDFSLLGTPRFSNSFCCRDALKLYDPGWQKIDNLRLLDPSDS
ncbi:PREDICTED: uncharacterized protein LOC104808347 [Tarenaya hassleriana]|uniref:uncharacterized protein LOC104808347 n=1 Tax=Tarenaya hassleriana TaxID=28532 RepID=UPI00053C6377|nr:PREDICTED: uncharacterized protein LOC104808347 [Tarenaya hassleriana]